LKPQALCAREAKKKNHRGGKERYSRHGHEAPSVGGVGGKVLFKSFISGKNGQDMGGGKTVRGLSSVSKVLLARMFKRRSD